ncbi:MAG: hypothetical protein OXH50_08130 [Gemmatimonadetes bacterium]|nr:hypothetical protein [Gemmatimonadota bacterium]
MTLFTDELPFQDHPAPDLEPSPIDDRHVLSEIGLSGHEIRQILPFRASSDACGPVWKIK